MLYPVLYSDSARSKGVSASHLNGFPEEATVGEVLDDFFSDGKWDNFQQDGVTFVRYTGTGADTKNGERVMVSIYFNLKDDGTGEIDRISWNGETLSELKQIGIILTLSNSYCESHGLASSNALNDAFNELENALNETLSDSSSASNVSTAEPTSEPEADDMGSSTSTRTATRSDRKLIGTNGVDTYSELSGEISVDINSYVMDEMSENTKEYYLSYGDEFETAWLNAMYTDVYEYSGKYGNLDALSRFVDYLKFYDEATYYMSVEGVIQDLHEVWYDFDIETLTDEDAGVYVDRVIQIAENNGAEIQFY